MAKNENFAKIKLTLDGKEVEWSLDKIRKEAAKTAKQIADTDQSNKKLLKELQAKYNALRNAEEDLIPVMERVNHYMRELGQTSTRDIGRATRQLTELRDSMPGNHKDLAKLNGIIDKFKDWMKQNRDLGMTFEEASNRLNRLVNMSPEKLRQGLAAINKELETNGKLTGPDRDYLKSMARRYEAEIAVKQYGRTSGAADITLMNNEQLRAEQARMRSAYLATDGAQGYGTVSQEYLTRLQNINQLLKERTEAERQLDKAERDRVATEKSEYEALDVAVRLNEGKKVSLEELTKAEKTLQEQIKKSAGVNLSSDEQFELDRLQTRLQNIREAIAAANEVKLNFDYLEDEPTEKLERALKQLEEQEKHLAGTDERVAQQIAEDKRKIQAQIDRNRRATADFANAERVAANTGKHSVNELQQAYAALQMKLMGLHTGQKKEIAEVRQQMTQLRNAIDQTTGSIGKQNSLWKRAVANITAYVGVFGMFNWVKSKIQQVVTGSAELSDQMADIRKVSGLAMEDIEGLTRSLTKLDTRTTLSELERIAYAGAKLGFGEQGAEGLDEFTRAANQVNVALKEDLGDEALTALSKITENMGLIKKLGVEEAMLATSSAMFKLAATSTAAAGPIVEVTKRLAPVAQMSGFAAHEILALASSADSLQLMPEVVGTALSKMIMAMQNNHNLIENYLQIPDGTISSLFKAGKAMDALLLVMDSMKGKNVTEMDGLWKLLGSNGQRLITVVADMGTHTDVLRKHLETSTKAFKEATAVTEEYNIQQETAQAYFQRADNLWRNAFINPDSSLAVKEMAKAWYDFSRSLLQSNFSLKAINMTLSTLFGLVKLFIALLPMFAIGTITRGLALLVAKLRLTTVATEGFTLAWTRMTAATKASWIGLAAGAIAQLAYGIYYAVSATKDLESASDSIGKAMDKATEKADDEAAALKRLESQMKDTNIPQEERMKLLSKVNTDYSHYLDYLGLEIKTVDDLVSHYDDLVRVMKQRYAYQEREEYKRDVMAGEDGIRMQRRRAGRDLTNIAQSKGKQIDLSLIDTYTKSGMKPGEIANKLGENASSGWVFTRDDKVRDAIIEYAKKVQEEIKTEKEIDQAFAKEVDGFNYDKWLRSQVKGDFKIKKPKGGDGDNKKGLRTDLKEERDKAKAIIDNVKNYYKRQMNAVTDMANVGTIDEQTQKQMTDGLTERMNLALANVRKAIGGTKNDWEAFKKTMRDDLYEPVDKDGKNLSTEILDKVMDNDLVQLRKMITTLSKALGQNGSVLLDQILRKATENEGKVVSQANKLMRDRNDELLRKNYTEKTNVDYQNTMEQFGIASLTQQQSEQIRTWSLAADDKAIKDFFEKRTAKWQEAFTAAREKIIEIINNPIEKEGDEEMLLRILFGDDYESKLAGSALEGMLSQTLDQWRVFYGKLIEYTDAYTDSEKRAYDENKKRQDYIFNNRPDILGIDNAADLLSQSEREQNRFGETASFGRQMGMVNTIENDPELMRYNVLQARAELYYNNMKRLREQNLVSEEHLTEAQKQMTQARIDMQDKLMESIQARTQALQNAVQPISDFAEQAGQKLGDMIFNMDSQSMTWNQIWRNMLLSMGKSIIQMGAQYATQKLQRSLFNAQIEAQETEHQALLTAIVIGGAMARMQGELAIEQGALVMKKVVDGQEVTEEISMATILTALGISKGAAKIIGSLGWLGIPLIAVISSLLMGLLSSALSTAGAESNTSSTTPTANTKLVSGMLTYDKGNVQRFIGQDGKVYTATEEPQPKDGLVTHPIATTVQGQPALLAENGPEIVIGRQTTRAIQMNEPELIKYLATYEQHGGRGYRPYDTGNIQDVPVSGGSASSNNDGNTNEAMQHTLTALNETVALLQKEIAKGIGVNMFGHNGLYENMNKANNFMKKYGG